MKRMGMKRLSVWFVLLVTVSVMLFPAFVLHAANDTEKSNKNQNFTVDTECGIDGFAAYDNPVVIKVTVESKSNFTGTLRIVPMMDNGQKTAAYGEEISLAAGEEKTFTFVPSVLGNSGKLKIELMDDKDKVVYTESKQVNLVSIGENVMVGILSDDYSALHYFDGMEMKLNNYSGIVSTLELNETSLPADSGALSVLDYIILDNFDTASLTDEQYAALKEWVTNGGVLILSLGSNYQNVLHVFTDDFITGTIGKLEKKDVMLGERAGQVVNGVSADNVSQTGTSDQNGLEDVNQRKDEKEEEPDDAWQDAEEFIIKGTDSVEFAFDGASELTDLSDNHTAYQKKIGAGNVVVLSYSLGMEPVISSTYKGMMACLVLQTTATDAVVTRLNGGDYNVNAMYSGIQLAKTADVNKKPSGLLYGGILFLYVVLVGPVLYLILKACKKREKIWLAIPLVSLAFTGIIYLTGFIYRVSKPLINTFSIVNVEDGLQTEKVYANITCPKAQEYTIRIKDGYSEFRYNMDDYSYSMFSSGDSDGKYDFLIRKTGEGTEISLDNEETFESTALYMKKTGENDMGTIDCDLQCTTTGFGGTITNNTNYDLKGVVATFENHFYQVGDMKRGEQITIDSSKMIVAYEYGTFERLYSSNPDLYSNRELYTEYQIDTTMENSFIDKEAYNQGYVWGKISSYRPEIVGDEDVKQTGNAVVFQTYYAEYEDVEGVYYPSLKQMELASQGDYDPDGMLYNGAVTMTYSFEGYPGITTLENLSYGKTEVVDSASYGANGYANVYAYNSETGAYDLLFENSSTLSGAELQKYMAGNIIMLKYEPVDSMATYYMPRIAARGDK